MLNGRHIAEMMSIPMQPSSPRGSPPATVGGVSLSQRLFERARQYRRGAYGMCALHSFAREGLVLWKVVSAPRGVTPERL
jgi:hypothetical protein